MRARGARQSPVCRRPGWIARGGSSALALAVVLALVVAACDGASISPTATSASPTASPTEPSPSAGGSPSDVPTESPSEEPTVEPTESPTVEPTPSETAASPTASSSEGGTGACLGSSETRDFFASFAQSVSWPVYCVVLPKGWSVEKGTYRLRNGGRLTISYRRRADGARIVLDEGAVCAETTPCVPSGSDLGTTPFGDRQADLSSASGGLAAVVDETENPAWLLTGTGIDQGAFASIAAKLHLLDQ
jgi:hypothetical protein